MYQIRTRDGGELVATVRLDPYRFTMKKSNRDGLRRALAEAGERQQMNRTAGGDSDGGETSPETYQDPSDDFVLGSVVSAVHPGHTVVEADE